MLNALSNEPLTLDPSLKTGIGDSSAMLVGPASTDFSTSSSKICETITQNSNNCPTGFVPFPAGTNLCGSFYINTAAVPDDFRSMPNYPVYPAKFNTFYDEHFDYSNAKSYLTGGSCTATATQTYTCNGNVIGTFRLTKTYTFGTANGGPATIVTVTKQ